MECVFWGGDGCLVKGINGNMPSTCDLGVSFFYRKIVSDNGIVHMHLRRVSDEYVMWSLFGSRVGPSIVSEGGDGEPFVPVVLLCCCIEMKVLFDPLILSFREAVSLWVKGTADVLLDP